MRTIHLKSLVAAALMLCGTAAAAAATYGSGDLLYVVYKSRGPEVIVNLGPASFYASSAVPVPVTAFSAGDLVGAFGGTLPTGLRVGLFGNSGVDGYVASNGPGDVSRIGSSIGASNQIESFGSAWAFLSTPYAGNPNIGTYTFGRPTSYQATLNALSTGSLGGNVPFSVEKALATAPTILPFFFGQSNPFTGDPPVQKLLGWFKLETDGTLTFYPKRDIVTECVAGPATLNVNSNGHGFSFVVSMTDVTDPNSPFAVPLTRMDPAWISQAGSTVLPTPRSDAACNSLIHDGLWENLAHRLLDQILFDEPSDGVCSTLDGDRQDIISVIGNVPDASDVPACFASHVDLNPVSCCSLVTVLNKGNR